MLSNWRVPVRQRLKYGAAGAHLQRAVHISATAASASPLAAMMALSFRVWTLAHRMDT